MGLAHMLLPNADRYEIVARHGHAQLSLEAIMVSNEVALQAFATLRLQVIRQ